MKLDNVLWVYRTTYNTPIGTYPYHLVSGKAFHLPLELEHQAYWVVKRFTFHAYENAKLYKKKTKRWNDEHIVC